MRTFREIEVEANEDEVCRHHHVLPYVINNVPGRSRAECTHKDSSKYSIDPDRHCHSTVGGKENKSDTRCEQAYERIDKTIRKARPRVG